MITNHKQYRVVCGQFDALNRAINEYKEKVEADKDNLKLKLQLDTFNGQLYEVRQELEAYEQRGEFRKYAKDGNDDKVFEMSFGNPLLKNYLTREQLIRLSDYYEENIRKFLCDKLSEANKGLEEVLNKNKQKYRGF